MEIRSSRISASIARAISQSSRTIPKQKLLRYILSFFAFFKLFLARYRPADFLHARREVWQLDEEKYRDSFQPSREENGGATSKGKGPETGLIPVGDLGYSGSTFFATPDGKYLVKSLPRRFEHEFFTHDLFEPYMKHMEQHPESLLVRITDMVYTPQATLGGILGTAPTHHIVMENLLYGKNLQGEEAGQKWETYDLKPNDYFFPERDIASGRLAPESVKDRLVDEFPDKVRVSTQNKNDLLSILSSDATLLAENNAVDYSLFLVRYPAGAAVPSVSSIAHPWRTGVNDAEGKWTYRAVVLDFFWAKHKFRAKLMTGLVKGLNVVVRRGPMSITADPAEYRERFLKMVDEMVVGIE